MAKKLVAIYGKSLEIVPILLSIKVHVVWATNHHRLESSRPSQGLNEDLKPLHRERQLHRCLLALFSLDYFDFVLIEPGVATYQLQKQWNFVDIPLAPFENSRIVPNSEVGVQLQVLA